jgi:hypothetical protein
VVPFVVDSLYEKCGMEFVNLLEEIDKLMFNRVPTTNKTLPAFCPDEHPDNLTLLYKHLKDSILTPMGFLDSTCFNSDAKTLREKKKNTNFLKSAISEFDADIVNNVKPHRPNFKINFESVDPATVRYMSPIFVKVFDYNEDELSPLNLTIAQDIYSSVIQMLFNSLPDLVWKLLNLEYNGSANLSDKVVFETIITKVCSLPPQCTTKALFTSLLIDCCLNKKAGPQFKSNINSLMRQIIMDGKKYDPNAIDNVISIYAQIRTNIVEMSWDWADVEGADEPWKKFVVTEVLREVVSLTHYERLQDKEYMDVSEYVQTINAPKFYFVIDAPSHSNYSDYQALLDKFNSKLEDEEMLTFLTSNEIIVLSGAELYAVFYQVFFKKSSMSLTHLKTLMDRYRKT